MAFYCLTMLSIALELSVENPVYQDIASKFFEHFIRISDSMNAQDGNGLWDEEDGFYYDLIRREGKSFPLKTHSLVGLIPLIAVEILEEEQIEKLPDFSKRMQWFLHHRQDLERSVVYCKVKKEHGHRILAISSKERLKSILTKILDEEEFLSPFGLRSLSKYHSTNPYSVSLFDGEHTIDYAPGESTSFLFGGNSNWRGPIWFPINFLLIEALERYHHFYGEELRVEFPKGSGQKVTLDVVAAELVRRLTSLFLPDENNMRPLHGGETRFRDDPHFRDYLLYYEYFHAENGRGLGANHQTGWTALIAKMLFDKANK